MFTITRTDLRQLRQSPDFWVPMAILAGLFFIVIPTILLFAIGHAGRVGLVQQIGRTLNVLPERVKEAVDRAGQSPEGRAQYAMAVYLFAPLAVVVPLTISTAIGANTIVGEREKGTGEFLAHSPASEREIYIGKLIGSILPGYAATLIGFGVYALVVNVMVGPKVGGWFFPTGDWWLLMLWVVPPFIMLALSAVLRISARVRSATAAQQASGLVTLPLILVAYAQSSGALLGRQFAGWVVGGIAWGLATIGLIRGARAVTRERLLGVDRQA
jgi:ABC-type transport system involved in multi-copper enzyme maturation permease subunit